MKRQAFIRELERAGCEFVRHGKRHDVYRNPANGQQAPVPRHFGRDTWFFEAR